MNILEQIIEIKKKEVEEKRQRIDVNQLEKRPYFKRESLSLEKSIIKRKGKAVIAEYKRRSPSKGVINNRADVVTTVKGYQEAGAVAASILTDEMFFGGSINDIIRVRDELNFPILRKDFIIDPYQVIEAKAIGADVILLIATCLDEKKLKSLYELALSLGLEVLFEIYMAEEINKLPEKAKLIGINNRNLKNFEVNIEHSISIGDQLPESSIKIAESGISSVKEAIILAEAGFDGFLIGENFMKYESPYLACKSFIESL